MSFLSSKFPKFPASFRIKAKVLTIAFEAICDFPLPPLLSSRSVIHASCVSPSQPFCLEPSRPKYLQGSFLMSFRTSLDVFFSVRAFVTTSMKFQVLLHSSSAIPYCPIVYHIFIHFVFYLSPPARM